MSEIAKTKTVPFAWLLALLLSLALLALESFQRFERSKMLTEMDGGFSFLQDDAQSLTGYNGGVRNLVASDRNDDLHWVVNLQHAEAEAVHRLRQVDYDNAPAGREVHWSSVYGWWIRAVSFGGMVSLEWSALYANVVLAAVLMVLLAFYIRRVSGPASTVALCLGLLAFLPLRDVYKFGTGDHHAAAIFATMVGVLFFAYAVRQRVPGRGGALETLLSSAAFSLAMWVNVVSVLPVFLGIGFAALLIRFVVGPDASLAAMFRNWAWLGAVCSTLAYLVEYAPSHMALRLEVNHPLYSLAWLGASELLAVLFVSDFKKSIGRAALAALMIAPLPFVLLSLGAEVFQVRDPFLLAVHERYIMEFQTLWANLAVMTSPLRLLALLLPLLVLAVGVAALIFCRSRRGDFATLAAVVAPACILFLITLYQARWWSQLSALLAVVLVFIFVCSAPKVFRWVAVGSLIPGFLIFVYGAFEQGAPVPRELTRVAERSVAHYLRARAGDGEVVVLASPDATTNQIYYGGAKGIGTFYWENNQGLKRAAEILASPDMETAKQRIEAAGVTHVLIYSWGGFEKEYVDLHLDFSGQSASDGKSFLMRLMEDQEIPLWLKPVPFRIADRELGVALIYEVVPELSEGQHASQRFEYMLEMGMTRPAFSLESLLRQYSDDPAAAVSLCRLYALQQRKAELNATLSDLNRKLGNDSSLLRIEDAIRYSGVLGIWGQRSSAKEALQSVAVDLRIEDMLKLNSETIRHFWDLVDALQVEVADSELRAQSEALLPSRLR